MTPGSIWFRVCELLGCTLEEARHRMTPAELNMWADHWAKFSIYDQSLMSPRPQTDAEIETSIRAFFANLGTAHGQ